MAKKYKVNMLMFRLLIGATHKSHTQAKDIAVEAAFKSVALYHPTAKM